MLFEFNFNYYPCILCEKGTNPYHHLKITDKIVAELEKLLAVFHENFYHV